LASQHGDNLTFVKWSSHKAVSYLSGLEIKGIDRIGMLLEIVQTITVDLSINIRELHIQTHDGIFECKINMYVLNAEVLQLLISKLHAIKGVESVVRKTLEQA